MNILKRNIAHQAVSKQDKGVLKHFVLKYPKLLNELDNEGYTILGLALQEKQFHMVDLI